MICWLCYIGVLIIVLIYSYRSMADEMLLSSANRYVHSMLTIFGMVPFIGGTLLLYGNITTWPHGVQVAETMNVYGVLIVSFLAGSHWGMTLSPDGAKHLYAAICSNIVVVLLWLSYSVLSIPAMLVLESMALGILLVQERATWEIHSMPAGYASMRVVITILVMVLLLLMAYKLW